MSKKHIYYTYFTIWILDFNIIANRIVNYHYPKGIVASGRNTLSLSSPD
jgi:hypothetical protein